MRSLLILAQNASPNAAQAGHKLAFEFAKDYSIDSELDIVLLINSNDRVDTAVWGSIDARIVYIEKFNFSKKVFNIVAHLFSIPPRFSPRISRRAVVELNKIVDRACYDEIIFEFSQVMPYVQKIRRTNSVKNVASIHDVQSQVVSRCNFLEKVFFYKFTAKYERGLIEKFDLIYTLSEKDRQILCKNTSPKNIIVRVPVIDRKYIKFNYIPESVEKGTMLFWGAMNRKENEQAAKYFVKKIFPKVRKKIPYARLFIVGNNPSSSLRKLGSENVVITGYIEEPLDYFKKAQVGVVPLKRGAGVKIKTLEMLSFGMPVLSTEIGAEGIEQHDNLMVEDLQMFADKLIEYFKNH